MSCSGSQRILMRLQVFINQECTSVPLALSCRAAQLSAAEQQLSSSGALGNHKQQSAKLCSFFFHLRWIFLPLYVNLCRLRRRHLSVVAERKRNGFASVVTPRQQHFFTYMHYVNSGTHQYCRRNNIICMCALLKTTLKENKSTS